MEISQEDLRLERVGFLRKGLRAALVGPFINYLIPRRLLRFIVSRSRSPLLSESLRAPGSWRSMMAAYAHQKPKGFVDYIVSKYGSFPMGLRNRKRLVVRWLSRILDGFEGRVNIVSMGAGAGANILEAMARSRNPNVHAYCLDLAGEAFEYGRLVARGLGLLDRVRFIQGDAVNIEQLIQVEPRVVTAIGILEYLSDQEIINISRAMYSVLPIGGYFLCTSLTKAHGIDRFLRTVLKLHLRYRDSEDVKNLLRGIGFNHFEVEYEPLRIYSVITAQKRLGA